MKATPAALITASLLLMAAAGAVIRAVGAPTPGRLALIVAAIVIVVLASGSVQMHPVALGVGFFVALCWLWAAIAQGLQRRMGAGETLFWITWSIAVMIASVRARARTDA